MKRMIMMTIVVLALYCLAGCSSKPSTQDDPAVTAKQDSAGSEKQDKSDNSVDTKAKSTPTPQPTPTPEPSLQMLADAKVGDIITFGAWWFGDYEKIEWIVLDENDNGLLLLSRYVLKEVDYIEMSGDPEYDAAMSEPGMAEWEISKLRNYLNGEFYRDAFSDGEKRKIKSVSLVNDFVWEGERNERHATEDKVFCLSMEEAKKYFPVNRQDEYSERAFSEAAIAEPLPGSNLIYGTISEDDYENRYIRLNYSRDCIEKQGTAWWFRTPEWIGVASDGCMEGVSYSGAGVRPAMYVNR